MDRSSGDSQLHYGGTLWRALWFQQSPRNRTKCRGKVGKGPVAHWLRARLYGTSRLAVFCFQCRTDSGFILLALPRDEADLFPAAARVLPVRCWLPMGMHQNG